MTAIDPTHPLHRASFYLEDLKWGRPGWDSPDADPAVTAVGTDVVEGQLVALLRDAKLDIDEAALRTAADHYATSYARQLGVPLIVARSIFMDGLTHGIALAAGLEGEIPEVYRDPAA